MAKPTPAPIPVKFADVLTALQQYLLNYPDIAALNLSADRIYLALENFPFYTTGDYSIAIQPQGERQDGTSFGSGRVEFRALRTVKLMVQTRLGTDEVRRDDDFLKGTLTQNLISPTLGHLAFEDMIVDAMILFQPEDEDGNVLTYKPCVYRNIERPEKSHIQERASAYGHSWLYFEIGYIRLLNQAQQ